ncbi:MAG: single-stranded-DNA-specific exonuclease RecJ, partial [Alphaproteobacteria bacterium]|nr:single-stranded-DNA-specific exonuclease RecJ [Alphaproteobacteria bacterium]
MADAALQVEKSLMLSRWVIPQASSDLIEQIARQHDLPEIVARLLAIRNVPPAEVDAFLHPRLAAHFPDPFSLAGMDALAPYLADAITGGRKIAVFGDFDVDGATSTAVMVRFLRHCGVDAPFYIPDRLAEGYGPNINALRTLKARGAEIVILLDCGITAHEVIAQGREIGLDIVVLDHHEAEEQLPPANHVINPKRKDDTSGLSMLAACGVTFLTCVAVNKVLRERRFFEGKAEAPLKDWLDIVALGTVCDMVPLTKVNRLIVRHGFTQMAARKNPGINALLEVAGIKGEPSVYHAGFALGPRINAGSRVHQADLGAKLLSTDSAEDAKNIAWTLNDCNDKRKELQSEMFTEAVNMVEDQRLFEQPFIMVGHEAWHPGLSGLVAGRLKEKYDKPAVCVTYAPGPDGALEGRGSGRSIPGVNMGAAFIDARNAGILLKGGGHAMAAGFSVMADRIDDFHAFLIDHIGRQMAGQEMVSETLIDAVLSVRGAQLDFIKIIDKHFGPFGQGHDEPLFALPSVRLHSVDVVGTDHVRCTLSDWEGGGSLFT